MDPTALLIIDEQVGAFDGKRVPAIHDADGLLDQTTQLLETARATHTLVIFVQHCAADGLFIKDTDAWHIHPRIAPKQNETVLLKQESSAFNTTDLEPKLAGQGIRTLVICGLQSEHCVFNTAVSALDLNFTVYVAGDAHSTWPSDQDSAPAIIQRQNLLLAQRGANVQSTRDMVSLLLT